MIGDFNFHNQNLVANFFVLALRNIYTPSSYDSGRSRASRMALLSNIVYLLSVAVNTAPYVRGPNVVCTAWCCHRSCCPVGHALIRQW